MQPDSQSNNETSSEERVQANTFFGSPVFLGIGLACLAIVVWSLVSSDPQDETSVPPTTASDALTTTTAAEPPPEQIELVEIALDGKMVYPTIEGVGIVDLATGDFSQATTPLLATPDPGNYAILRVDGKNIIVDQQDPSIYAISEIQGDIVSTAQQDRFVSVLFGGVTGGDPVSDTRYAFTLRGSYGVKADELGLISVAEIDNDAYRLLVEGLGAIIESSDGGTFVFDRNGFRRFSEHRVLAASVTAHIEQRCETPEVCKPIYVNDGDEIELPNLFTYEANISISPDGEWILLDLDAPELGPSVPQQGAGLQLYDVANNRFVPVAVPEVGEVRWHNESRYVAWLDPSETKPQLVVVFPGTGTSRSINLAALGAPDRIGSEMLFVAG